MGTIVEMNYSLTTVMALYKSHDLFSTVPSSLEILAYYDDVEVCNPLGSRAKKHKLGVPVCSLRYRYVCCNVVV